MWQKILVFILVTGALWWVGQRLSRAAKGEEHDCGCASKPDCAQAAGCDEAQCPEVQCTDAERLDRARSAPTKGMY